MFPLNYRCESSNLEREKNSCSYLMFQCGIRKLHCRWSDGGKDEVTKGLQQTMDSDIESRQQEMRNHCHTNSLATWRTFWQRGKPRLATSRSSQTCDMTSWPQNRIGALFIGSPVPRSRAGRFQGVPTVTQPMPISESLRGKRHSDTVHNAMRNAHLTKSKPLLERTMNQCISIRMAGFFRSFWSPCGLNSRSLASRITLKLFGYPGFDFLEALIVSCLSE
jgi:hypothetical protein